MGRRARVHATRAPLAMLPFDPGQLLTRTAYGLLPAEGWGPGWRGKPSSWTWEEWPLLGWTVRILSTVKCSRNVNEREGRSFHRISDSTTFLEDAACASLAPTLLRVVPVGPALALTGEHLHT